MIAPLGTVKRLGSCVGLGAVAGLAEGEIAEGEIADGEIVGVGLAGGGLTEGAAEAAGLSEALTSAVALGTATATADGTSGRGAMNRSTATPMSTIATIAPAMAKRTRTTTGYYLAVTM